ncbi:uncharacterized protein GGS25DRAFT_488366 [Hypoxylon fragiforme]|uniref:uncharacterized protein n=1 Tax=Hypoxylon fragiforme TaxID=63214 RepID=UPI0020C715E4|nr:uncharacterized protein GGS25DRAFT_488366 [Hypoxylon fragiforme]KAI2610312.1 hypothetical protein GGS25DRAFT_488366 [Hypoxylon fragiforme]
MDFSRHGVFSETIQEITNSKLERISKSRSHFEHHKSLAIGVGFENLTTFHLDIIGDKVRTCWGLEDNNCPDCKYITPPPRNPSLELELKSLDCFLFQVRWDPCLADDALPSLKESLLRHLDIQSLKYSYTRLYGRLVTEWLSTDKLTRNEDEHTQRRFKQQHSKEEKVKVKARMQWSPKVFVPAEVNEEKLRTYLDDIFDVQNVEKLQRLDELRTEIEDFEELMSAPDQFYPETLDWVIRGLSSSRLISDEKRRALENFNNNHLVREEISNILNQRMQSLDSWSWGECVVLDQERDISGTCNILMQEDLLQAIILYYIGIKWSTILRKAIGDFLFDFYAVHAPRVSKKDAARRSQYSLRQDPTGSVQSIRDISHRASYSMALLNKHGRSGKMQTEDEEEAEYRIQDKRENNPDSTKRQLLRLLSTEIAVNTKLYNEITAFHSLFDKWTTLLPHETILGVLSFLGVSKSWLSFFRSFLKMPLRLIEDDQSECPRIRSRGMPELYILSEALGESVLFCLDVAVSKQTNGAKLYRMRNDCWFWSKDVHVAEAAWKTITKFANVTGTEINYSRSGTLRVSSNPGISLPRDQSFPKGNIRWGFLKLSPKTGIVKIDQKLVDKHIKVVRMKLAANSNSILAFVQAWNIYVVRFFTSNFGEVVNCFGYVLVNELARAHWRIHRELVPPPSSSTPSDKGSVEYAKNIVDYLKYTIRERFSMSDKPDAPEKLDIPNALFYFPVELGGLGLENPLISLSQVNKTVLDPSELLESFLEAEKESYESDKRAWEQRDTHDTKPGLPVDFMSFDNYVLNRESIDHDFEHNLSWVYNKLMEAPRKQGIEKPSAKVMEGLEALAQQHPGTLKHITGHWESMSPYWRLVVQLYGPELMDKIGCLNMVEPGSLPMGMISAFHEGQTSVKAGRASEPCWWE